jgi:hypothetical protein
VEAFSAFYNLRACTSAKFPLPSALYKIQLVQWTEVSPLISKPAIGKATRTAHTKSIAIVGGGYLTFRPNITNTFISV